MLKVTFVLDNVRSAFNVGSIFRTADGLGFFIHLIGITPIPHKDKKLYKTSLNSLDFVEWKYFDDEYRWFEYVVLLMREKGEKSVIFSIEETEEFETISFFDLQRVKLENYNCIYVILGHEINGVNKFLMSKSDFIVKIPMFGKKNSLNVATCAGIVGYKFKELITLPHIHLSSHRDLLPMH